MVVKFVCTVRILHNNGNRLANILHLMVRMDSDFVLIVFSYYIVFNLWDGQVHKN